LGTLKPGIRTRKTGVIRQKFAAENGLGGADQASALDEVDQVLGRRCSAGAIAAACLQTGLLPTLGAEAADRIAGWALP